MLALTTRTRHFFALMGITSLMATLMIAVVVTPAAATTVSVGSEQEFRQALDDLRTDSDGPHTITFTQSFTITDPDDDGTPEYRGGQDLTIDGGGHTVDYTPEPGSESAFLEFLPSSGGTSLTVHDLTVEGFDDIGALSFYYSFIGGFFGTGTLTVVNTHFLDNHKPTGTEGGGAIYAEGSMVIVDSTFVRNAADRNGGAIEVEGRTSTNFGSGVSTGTHLTNGSSVVIENSTFEDNSSNRRGGGIYAFTGEVTVTKSDWRRNVSQDDGGAIYGRGVVEIDDSDLTDNSTAVSGEGKAGAIYADEGMSVSGSTLASNTADNDGGALYSEFGEISVVNSTLSANRAGGEGGAIFARTGGSAVDDGHVEIAWSSLVDNYSDEGGSHVYAMGTFESYGSVYAGAVNTDGCVSQEAVVSAGYNFDQDGTCAAGGEPTDFGLGQDPHLGALTDNSGPMPTMLPAQSSPLVDVIPEDVCDQASDQRGVERPAGDACDVGAVERLTDITFTIATDNGDIEALVTNAQCVEDVAWTNVVTGAPAGLSLPFGVSGYSFCVPVDGWTVHIELDLPRPVNSLWKVSGDEWSEVTSAEFDGAVVRYSVTDGGPLDEDGLANGYIVDPVAPGILSTFTG